MPPLSDKRSNYRGEVSIYGVTQFRQDFREEKYKGNHP